MLRRAAGNTWLRLVAEGGCRVAPRAVASAGWRSLCDSSARGANRDEAPAGVPALLKMKKEGLVSRARALGLPVSALVPPLSPRRPPALPCDRRVCVTRVVAYRSCWPLAAAAAGASMIDARHEQSMCVCSRGCGSCTRAGPQTTGSKVALATRICLESPHAPASAPQDSVAALKVVDLRARLKALGASTAGNKADLQVRLRAHLFLAEDDGKSETEAVNGGPERAPSRPWHAAATYSETSAAAARREASEEAAVPHDQGARSVTGEAKVSVSGGSLGLTLVVDKTQKRKGTDELGLTRQERALLLQSRVLSLYRRFALACVPTRIQTHAHAAYAHVHIQTANGFMRARTCIAYTCAADTRTAGVCARQSGARTKSGRQRCSSTSVDGFGMRDPMPSRSACP